MEHSSIPQTAYTAGSEARGDKAPAFAIPTSVFGGIPFEITVNGAKVDFGDIDSVCFLSSDGGISAKKNQPVTDGDVFYWNESRAGYHLDAADKVGITFLPASSAIIPQSKANALIMKGGGIKGLAYVGALEELEGRCDFDWFVGTSAGAITAALLAGGYSTKELRDLLVATDFRKFLDDSYLKLPWNLFSRGGIYRADALTDWIDALLAKKLNSPTQVTFRQLPRRLTVYASRRGKRALRFDSEDVACRETPVSFAVRASMSIPLVFTPERHAGMRVFDGGMQNNFPVLQLLESSPGKPFVGLYLGPEHFEGRARNSLLSDLIAIWTEAVDEEALAAYPANILICDPRPISTLDFSLSEKEKDFLLLAGRSSAREFLRKSRERQNPGGLNAPVFRSGYDHSLGDSLANEVEARRSDLKKLRKSIRTKRLAWIGLTLALLVLLLAAVSTTNRPDLKTESVRSSNPAPTPEVLEDFTDTIYEAGLDVRIDMDHVGGDPGDYSGGGVDTMASAEIKVDHDAGGVSTVYLRGKAQFKEKDGNHTEWVKNFDKPLKQFPGATELRLSPERPFANFSIFRPAMPEWAPWTFGADSKFPTGSSTTNFVSEWTQAVQSGYVVFRTQKPVTVSGKRVRK